MEYEVTVIPQTVRLTPSETIASVQSESRHFLIQSSTLPDSLNWLDCELVVEDQVHPYGKDEKRGVVSRDMNLHALPWPKEELEALGDAEVQ